MGGQSEAAKCGRPVVGGQSQAASRKRSVASGQQKAARPVVGGQRWAVGSRRSGVGGRHSALCDWSSWTSCVLRQAPMALFWVVGLSEVDRPEFRRRGGSAWLHLGSLFSASLFMERPQGVTSERPVAEIAQHGSAGNFRPGGTIYVPTPTRHVRRHRAGC